MKIGTKLLLYNINRFMFSFSLRFIKHLKLIRVRKTRLLYVDGSLFRDKSSVIEDNKDRDGNSFLQQLESKSTVIIGAAMWILYYLRPSLLSIHGANFTATRCGRFQFTPEILDG